MWPSSEGAAETLRHPTKEIEGGKKIQDTLTIPFTPLRKPFRRSRVRGVASIQKILLKKPRVAGGVEALIATKDGRGRAQSPRRAHEIAATVQARPGGPEVPADPATHM